jgi:hypothetical protein
MMFYLNIIFKGNLRKPNTEDWHGLCRKWSLANELRAGSHVPLSSFSSAFLREIEGKDADA